MQSRKQRASLGLLFLAVQLVDVVFFPLVLLGIERLNVIENFTATHFELVYMPYTHSLLASIIWAALLLAGGVWLYLGATTATTVAGKYSMGVFVGLLLLVIRIPRKD